jgi:hypothetical protein
MGRLGLGWIWFHKVVTELKRMFGYGTWFSTLRDMQILINKL